MSFDMTEKLIHSTPLDDDTAQMMIEMDIRKESIKEMNEEMEGKKGKEGIEETIKRNGESRSRGGGGKDGIIGSDRDENEDENMTGSDQDQEIAEEVVEERNVLEAFNIQDSW